MTAKLDLADLRAKAEAARLTWHCAGPGYCSFIAAANPATVLALLDRIDHVTAVCDELTSALEFRNRRLSDLESERAINHERLAANDKYIAEQAKKMLELVQTLSLVGELREQIAIVLAESAELAPRIPKP